MKHDDVAGLLAMQGIAIPTDRIAEFQRNHQDLRALVGLIRAQAPDGDPWTPPTPVTPATRAATQGRKP